jgi:hypothetical protein
LVASSVPPPTGPVDFDAGVVWLAAERRGSRRHAGWFRPGLVGGAARSAAGERGLGMR